MAPRVWARGGTNRQAGRAMPQFCQAGAWDEETILRRHGPVVEPERGDDAGVRPQAGSDVPTPGPPSVGVKRQYGGELGQGVYHQAGACWGEARRRYRPQEGLEDAAEADRWAACGVPAAVLVTPRPRRGGTLLQAVHQATPQP
jgi:hypothetical protein